MNKFISEQKENIFQQMIKRSVSMKWFETLLDKIPDEIKQMENPVKDDEHYEEYQNYQKVVKGLDDMAEAEKSDIFAYKVLDDCYKQVINKLK